jgi:hypothetical protein
MNAFIPNDKGQCNGCLKKDTVLIELSTDNVRVSPRAVMFLCIECASEAVQEIVMSISQWIEHDLKRGKR